jgi:hypothetical protein
LTEVAGVFTADFFAVALVTAGFFAALLFAAAFFTVVFGAAALFAALFFVNAFAGFGGAFAVGLRVVAAAFAFAWVLTEAFDFAAAFFDLEAALAMTINSPHEGDWVPSYTTF